MGQGNRRGVMFQEWVDGVLAWIGAHREWTLVVALVFAAAETTALTSLLIPSSAILVGVGALVATGEISFLPLWIGATVGAAIGSSFSWWLGWHYGDAILQWRVMTRNQPLVDRTRDVFARHGGLAVLGGHFVGPFRPFAFLLAGLTRMSFARFSAFNLPGCVAWAAVVPAIGYLGGTTLGWILDYLPI
jgi:membrane protein DedA with SNARE-associated domain